MDDRRYGFGNVRPDIRAQRYARPVDSYAPELPLNAIYDEKSWMPGPFLTGGLVTFSLLIIVRFCGDRIALDAADRILPENIGPWRRAYEDHGGTPMLIIAAAFLSVWCMVWYAPLMTKTAEEWELANDMLCVARGVARSPRTAT